MNSIKREFNKSLIPITVSNSKTKSLNFFWGIRGVNQWPIFVTTYVTTIPSKKRRINPIGNKSYSTYITNLNEPIIMLMKEKFPMKLSRSCPRFSKITTFIGLGVPIKPPIKPYEKAPGYIMQFGTYFK